MRATMNMILDLADKERTSLSVIFFSLASERGKDSDP